MSEIELNVEDPRWQASDPEGIIARVFAAVRRELSLPPQSEISVLLCDDARIVPLNQSFRSKAQPTNVLSWPSEERAAQLPGGTPYAPTSPELGDIALAYETCAGEATAQSKSFHDHVTHLVLHGLLHLLGYDHETEQDAALMEGLERKILANLGIEDPYSDDRT